MSHTEPAGFHCGGVNCESRHQLPEAPDAAERRSAYGQPCVNRPVRRPLYRHEDPLDG
ncbi:hypothetical protein AB0C76_32855 [Kitasatospora sp. NPDC048722]|uniref:hypothetical protein n=1 Tax=Kitasatospora sp. NPDC048722 TaxID=3155639 RepID=UPI0033C8B7D9